MLFISIKEIFTKSKLSYFYYSLLKNCNPRALNESVMSWRRISERELLGCIYIYSYCITIRSLCYMYIHIPLIISFHLTYWILLCDLSSLSYWQFISYSRSQSEPLFGLILYNFYFLLYSLIYLYINCGCLKYMIHIAKNDIGVL